ncbi:hypothetical protein [Levilactobacillus fuyuanensis]|uniref:Uncharacterized protein n=1 Tax=Levilactobacillus fuyuanensis TaxID=2486022 RepID=A0ABW4H3N0_9LACO|nr:hypothetical protein [Levilactobacillus fuyuanensis]
MKRIFQTAIGFIIGIFLGGIGLDQLGESDLIQFLSAIGALLAFWGVLYQVSIQVAQFRMNQRPRFNFYFKNAIQAGDRALSKSNSWDFKKYYRTYPLIQVRGDIPALDVLMIAESNKQAQDYLYSGSIVNEKFLLDFEGVRPLRKLTVYFKTNVDEFGKVVFVFGKKRVLIPKYTWGRNLKKEYHQEILKVNNLKDNADTDFEFFNFTENDLKTFNVYNENMLKKEKIWDDKDEAVDELVFGIKRDKNKTILERSRARRVLKENNLHSAESSNGKTT